jgi:hypothetical protein
MKLLQVHVAVNWRPNVGYEFSADLRQGGTTEGPMGTVARHRDICRLSRGGSDLDRCVAALMHGQGVPAGLMISGSDGDPSGPHRQAVVRPRVLHSVRISAHRTLDCQPAVP